MTEASIGTEYTTATDEAQQEADLEKAMLDRAIETGEALTEAEMKSIKRQMAIEELGI